MPLKIFRDLYLIFSNIPPYCAGEHSVVQVQVSVRPFFFFALEHAAICHLNT